MKNSEQGGEVMSARISYVERGSCDNIKLGHQRCVNPFHEEILRRKIELHVGVV